MKKITLRQDEDTLEQIADDLDSIGRFLYLSDASYRKDVFNIINRIRNAHACFTPDDGTLMRLSMSPKLAKETAERFRKRRMK